MNQQSHLMKALQAALDDIAVKIKAGDSGAHVEWSMGAALYEYLAAGHALTDLDWFKETTLYTGGQKQAEAA